MSAFKPLSFLVSLYLLLSCSSDAPSPLDAQWERQVTVPKGVQGRCYKEIWTLDEDEWKATFLMYNSYLCENPSIEMTVKADATKLTEAEDKWLLTLNDLKITHVFNITGTERHELPRSSVKRFNQDFMPSTDKVERVKLRLDKSGVLSAGLLSPLYRIAIPEGQLPTHFLRFSKKTD